MSINLNLALQALDNETIVLKPNGKKYRKPFKNRRCRYTNAGKLISASASNKKGFNITNVKPLKKKSK